MLRPYHVFVMERIARWSRWQVRQNPSRGQSARVGEEPVPFDAVLADEMASLSKRRQAINEASSQLKYSDAEDAAAQPDGNSQAHVLRPFGVCLSGGGIRSATFNLGVIQGLCTQG